MGTLNDVPAEVRAQVEAAVDLVEGRSPIAPEGARRAYVIVAVLACRNILAGRPEEGLTAETADDEAESLARAGNHSASTLFRMVGHMLAAADAVRNGDALGAHDAAEAVRLAAGCDPVPET